ncbi:hypothetical protein IE4803_CH00116 [Rhizobium etli bv. phaseoli str. IE4803]|nr:hypothetical protein IE4803_CH00116 [Rhizobium etli bv. phaseoli str. IE4803]
MRNWQRGLARDGTEPSFADAITIDQRVVRRWRVRRSPQTPLEAFSGYSESVCCFMR